MPSATAVAAARQEGLPVAIGFAVVPEPDPAAGSFWPAVAALGGSAFAASIDYVGVAMYPDVRSLPPVRRHARRLHAKAGVRAAPNDHGRVARNFRRGLGKRVQPAGGGDRAVRRRDDWGARGRDERLRRERPVTDADVIIAGAAPAGLLGGSARPDGRR